MPPTAPRFISVGDLLLDVASGLGAAHKRLVEQSESPIGTLAVKTADVRIVFEMTSTATARDDSFGAGVPFLLGAKTLSLTTSSNQSTDQSSNRAEIALSIVNVAPQAPASDAAGDKGDKGVVGGGKKRPKWNLPGGGPRKDLPTIVAAIGVIRSGLARANLSDKQKAELAKQLNKAEALAKKGDASGAESVLRSFTERMRPRPD